MQETFNNWINDVKNFSRSYEDFFHSSFFSNIKGLLEYLKDLELKYPRVFEVEKLFNKNLLIIAENGYGDAILHWRYTKKLADIASSVYFVVPEPLIPLFKKDLPTTSNIKLGPTIPNITFDNMLYLFDLFLLFDREPLGKYLDIGEKPVSKGIKIGLALGSTDTEGGMRYRNVPRKYTKYFKFPNTELYNFSNYKSSYINVLDNCKDFLQTAHQIQQMDYFISADNCMLHLAGALGVRTYALFNKDYEWIWPDLNKDNVGWYSSAKPFVCREADDWFPIILEVRKLLNFDIESKL